MKSVELDAAERRERKQRDSKRANELKEKGNNSFKRKDYDEAVKYYDEAIKLIRDNTILFTNRAQVIFLHNVMISGITRVASLRGRKGCGPWRDS